MRNTWIGTLLLIALAWPALLAAQTVNPNRAIVPPVLTLQNAATANGNGTAVNVAGYASVLLDVTCTSCVNTTVNFEASADASVYTPILASHVTTATLDTRTSATSMWRIPVGGTVTMIRARISSYFAGTITVKAYPSILMAPALVTQSLPATLDEAPFTFGTSALMPIGGTYFSILDPIASNTQAMVALTPYRDLHVSLFDGTGNALKGVQNKAVSIPVNIAADQVVPVSGTFWQATQPVSGTVTAVQPTATNFNAAVVGTGTAGSPAGGVLTVQGAPSMTALFVAGAVASGATDAGNPLKIGGVYNTTPITLTNGQRGDVQLDANGYLKMNLAATNSAAVLGHVITDSGSTTVVTGNTTVVGAAASGAAKAGNPVQMGGVFNTTQPTVTTGQAVEFQASPRGALLIATGAETPVSNLTLVAGTAISTGLGAAGAGTPRVVDVASGTAGSAVPTQASYQAGIGTGNLRPIIACDNYKALDMTSATTTEIIPAAPASQNNYICSYSVLAAGTTIATFKYGTGTNCATAPTNLGPAWDLTAQAGLTRGSGLGMVVTDKTAGVTAKAICVTSSAAVNLHIEVTYTQF